MTVAHSKSSRSVSLEKWNALGDSGPCEQSVFWPECSVFVVSLQRSSVLRKQICQVGHRQDRSL